MDFFQRIARIVGTQIDIAKTNSRLRVARRNYPVVSYAHPGFPKQVRNHAATGHGGSVKYRHLDEKYPHSNLECNILYIVSSGRYAGLRGLLKKAKSQGIAIVWNQNGAYFPSAYGHQKAQNGNAEMREQIRHADFVFYQSNFAKIGSDHFLGTFPGPSEILYNAVDTSRFSPAPLKKSNEVKMLLCGSHNDSYRLPLAVEVLQTVLDSGVNAKLLVAGRIPENILQRVQKIIANSNELPHRVIFHGPYSQSQAPDIYRRADMLLHTQYNDVCPSVVVEAMASGLPIVYSDSGGTPELVGDEAGIGVDSLLDWEVAHPPSADQLASAVLALRARLNDAGAAARQRAVDSFDLTHWVQRHHTVFLKVMESNKQ